MTVSILTVVGLSYARMLEYFLTATDTPTLIDASRIGSFEDAGRIVTEPLMSGTDFVNIARFYRPVTSLSYSFDYAVWGLDPFGYHLTDLLLHAVVCLLVFALAWLLTGGRRLTAWLGSLVFATHPILVEIVPATARRHDVIATGFILLSLIFFLSRRSTRGWRAGFVCSLISYVLALGAKEIAVVLPFLIWAHLWIYSSQSHRSSRFLESLRGAFPYFAVSVAYFAWWSAVVRGSGGYLEKDAGMLEMIVILKSYLLDLAYPAGPITFARLARACAWVILLSAFCYGVTRRRGEPTSKSGRSRRSTANVMVLAAASGLGSAAAIAAYPLLAPVVGRFVEQAYSGRGSPLLASLMDGKDSLPVEFYLDQLETVSTSLLALVMAVSVAFVLVLNLYPQAARSRAHAETFKHLLFLAIWLVLPLGVFLAALAFDHRNMYLPAVPFSLLLAIALIESAGATRRNLADRRARASFGESPERPLPGGPGSLQAVAAVGLLAATSGLLVNLVAFSPLLRDYREWRDSGEISRLFLTELVEIADGLPDGTRLRIHGLPDAVAYRDGGARVKSATFLSSYSIESWLEMARPGRRIEVELRDRQALSARPDAVGLEMRREDGLAAVTVRLESRERPPALLEPYPLGR